MLSNNLGGPSEAPPNGGIVDLESNSKKAQSNGDIDDGDHDLPRVQVADGDQSFQFTLRANNVQNSFAEHQQPPFKLDSFKDATPDQRQRI